MAEGASFIGAAWPTPAPPPLTPPLPFPPFQPQPRDFPSPEIPRAAEKSGADAYDRALLAAEKRRAYNREYMRAWRRRNLEHYRAQNREYQRRTALRRKLRRIAQAAENAPVLCAYGCGRPATTKIERVDPRTWKTSSFPYCGKC